jgi:hypothetical protein
MSSYREVIPKSIAVGERRSGRPRHQNGPSTTEKEAEEENGRKGKRREEAKEFYSVISYSALFTFMWL